MPYRSEGSIKQDRGLWVQVRVTGVEADNQKEKTKTVKSTGRWRPRSAKSSAYTIQDKQEYIISHTHKNYCIGSTVLRLFNVYISTYSTTYFFL